MPLPDQLSNSALETDVVELDPTLPDTLDECRIVLQGVRHRILDGLAEYGRVSVQIAKLKFLNRMQVFDPGQEDIVEADSVAYSHEINSPFSENSIRGVVRVLLTHGKRLQGKVIQKAYGLESDE